MISLRYLMLAVIAMLLQAHSNHSTQAANIGLGSTLSVYGDHWATFDDLAGTITHVGYDSASIGFGHFYGSEFGYVKEPDTFTGFLSATAIALVNVCMVIASVLGIAMIVLFCMEAE